MKISISKKINISPQLLFWLILASGFVQSPFLDGFPFFSLIYNVIEFICLIYILIHIRNFRINGLIILIILLELSQIISTLLVEDTGSNVRTTVIECLTVIVFCMFVQLMTQININLCVQVLEDLCEILIYLNVFSAILFPNGLYSQSDYLNARHYYFLGHQNQMGFYCLIAFALGSIRTKIEPNKYNKKRLYLLMVVSLYYVFRVWSVTSIIGVGLMSLLILYNDFSSRGFRIPVMFSLLGNIIFFILLVIEQNFSLFSNLIQNVFHRDMTLSTRTIIWNTAFNAFLLRPIWGWGAVYGKELFGFQTTHNRYLNILFTQGIVGMVLFLLMIMLVSKSLQDRNNYIVRIMLALFFCVFIMFQAETMSDYLFYIMFIIAYNIEIIDFHK